MGITYNSKDEPATSASTSNGGRGGAGRSSGGIYTSIKNMTRPSTAASASSGCRSASDYYYSSIDKVVQALAREGLRQSYLIIGVHFAKCNYGAGNPYERAISIIEKTLAPFDKDNAYPCFGFGDDGKVFSFHRDHTPCDGIAEVLACYNKIVPNVAVSGPTSYAPVIEAAVDTVEKRDGQFHTLVLVADNQVTRGFFNPKNGKLSPEGTETIKSITNASSCPLSIILVGVGCGSWEHMKKFQDKIPKRKFDNFQFVDFSEMYMTRDANSSKKEAAFAFAALKQIPLQYKTALELGIIGSMTGNAMKTVLCSPPVSHTRHAPPTSEPSNLPLPATAMNERCLQEEVTDAFRKVLESSNLIVGIDFTKSNECTGKVSFDGQNLHAINGDTPNPYEKVVTLVGKSFSPFQKDNLIHCFGFGDATTLDHEVFSFQADHSPCYDFEEVLASYKRIVRNVELAGRTSYAPMIEAAVDIVEKSGGQYHVLVIIAAGQVTRSSCAGNMSLQEEETIRSIADASSYPIFIILVGVGGGSWDDLKKLFAETIPACGNLKFVNFSDIMSRPATTSQKEVAFAHDALMEASAHYQSAVHCGIIGRTTGKANKVTPRPPPFPSTNRATSATPNPRDHSVPSVNYQRQMECPVCMVNEKDMALGCGHVVCEGCGTRLSNCPICRKSIHIRIKLYNV